MKYWFKCYLCGKRCRGFWFVNTTKGFFEVCKKCGEDFGVKLVNCDKDVPEGFHITDWQVGV